MASKRKRKKSRLFVYWGVKIQTLNPLVTKRLAPCWWCLTPISYNEATIEHLLPIGRNGGNQMANLRLACTKCNNELVNPLDIYHNPLTLLNKLLS